MNDRTFQNIGPLVHNRSRHAVVKIDRVVYLFGGDNYKTLDVWEQYEQNDEAAWKDIGVTLTEPRDWVSATNLNGKVYIGGNKVTKIDCFDPVSSTIVALELNFSSENATFASFNDYLYVF